MFWDPSSTSSLLQSPMCDSVGRERILASELIESLWLYGNDGTKYRALIFEDRINASALAPGSWISGERTRHLEVGIRLNQRDESTFKNPSTGELLSRIPPKLAEWPPHPICLHQQSRNKASFRLGLPFTTFESSDPLTATTSLFL